MPGTEIEKLQRVDPDVQGASCTCRNGRDHRAFRADIAKGGTRSYESDGLSRDSERRGAREQPRAQAMVGWLAIQAA
ncbi:MAG: hypothetical protein RMI94_06645 [Bryobacterales bacterium]|nr:hypothetical protein [Bryobacteraceae bacterium]MDW8130210.1 hypothetical protein [Bryobacterales bacterium]